jgi:flagella basal body P-ring formation protein FlgA
MNMNRSILIISMALLFFAAPQPEPQAATIMLRDEASVVSDVVRLGDVATIVGSEPRVEIEALRSIAICSAPPPAEVQLLSLATIVSALKASGADRLQLKVGGSPHVLVEREHALVSVEELQRIFTEHVSRQTGWPQDTFMVKAPKNLDRVPVPAGVKTIEVETYPGENFFGSVPAWFRVTVNGNPYCRLVHRFKIERYVEALVTARKIARGSAIRASDVEMKKVEQSLLDEESFTNAEQAVGLLATRTIHPGRILTARFLTEPPVVKRGEDTPVMWEGTGFHIETNGRVLEDGCANELVRVRLSSRKIVNAEVLDSGTLRIVQQEEQDEKLRSR